MWRWSEVLPVREQNHVIHLGEGDTPLLPQTRLGRALGVPRLATKAEGLNPTGSFKARGMAAALSRGIELGVTSFIAPSAGNAAGALAAYGAAAGVEITALLPADEMLVPSTSARSRSRTASRERRQWASNSPNSANGTSRT
jgi:threonine synthase